MQPIDDREAPLAPGVVLRGRVDVVTHDRLGGRAVEGAKVDARRAHGRSDPRQGRVRGGGARLARGDGAGRAHGCALGAKLEQLAQERLVLEAATVLIQLGEAHDHERALRHEVQALLARARGLRDAQRRPVGGPQPAELARVGRNDRAIGRRHARARRIVRQPPREAVLAIGGARHEAGLERVAPDHGHALEAPVVLGALDRAAQPHELAKARPLAGGEVRAAGQVGLALRVESEALARECEARGLEHARAHVVPVGLLRALRRRELAREQRAPGVEVRRTVAEQAAGIARDRHAEHRAVPVLGRALTRAAAQAPGHVVQGAEVADAVARATEELALRLEARGEVEQGAHGHARGARVVLPLDERVEDRLLELHEPVRHRCRRDDAAEALGAARERVRSFRAPAIRITLEHDLPRMQHEHHAPREALAVARRRLHGVLRRRARLRRRKLQKALRGAGRGHGRRGRLRRVERRDLRGLLSHRGENGKDGEHGHGLGNPAARREFR